jgi:YfiH family protein
VTEAMMIEYTLTKTSSKVRLFTTTRQGGVGEGNYATFNVSPFCGDNPDHVKHNLHKLAENLDVVPEKILIPYQTHGTTIQKVDSGFMQLNEDAKAAQLNGVDALITNIPGVCIGVTTADCVPIFFYDVVKQVVAVAHAGWRGTCAKITTKTIRMMISSYSSNPEDIQVVIGPSISVKAYQVGEELYDAFQKAGFPVNSIFIRNDQGLYLDLWKANEFLLLNEGLQQGHITIANRCSYTEHELFFSARRLGIKSGRMLSGICLSA